VPIEQVLVADDEPIMREFLSELLRRKNYDVTAASDGATALDLIGQGSFDLVMTDLKMPKATGLDILKQVKETSPQTIVIVMTAYGTVESAVEAMKGGAYDYLTKPCSPDQIDVVINKAVERQKLLEENQFLRSELARECQFEDMIGESPSMRKIYSAISKVAASHATVLVTGESGTGKELVARAIHYSSARKDRPFIRLNCAALAETLLESELFGHEKGAFTGATSRRQGRFELAHTGTLLLDEISETSLSLQAKLLRVLQEGEFERLGGSKTIRIDVRLICTTNRDLRREIAGGHFREDLFYRLNVVPIHLPPLRERREDIELLTQYFLKKYALRYNRNVMSVTPQSIEALESYDWPGNVRELENIIERAVVMDCGEQLDPEHLLFHTDLAGGGLDRANSLATNSLRDMEQTLILRVLDESGGNKTRAAKELGISVRTLHNKINEYRRQGILEGKFCTVR